MFPSCRRPFLEIFLYRRKRVLAAGNHDEKFANV